MAIQEQNARNLEAIQDLKQYVHEASRLRDANQHLLEENHRVR